MAKIAAPAKPRLDVHKLIHRDMSGLGLIDYALVGIGCSLAAWSGGMAINSEQIGFFGAGFILFGTIVSYLVRLAMKGSKIAWADGALYAIGGIAAAVFAVPLMKVMPSGGFPRELFAAGWLTWMMIFGSFVGWRDSTLLFQAVPAIAMFGLVGCYDTYRDVTFMFYGFLLCLATFFARAHARQMLEESVTSGYFSRALAPGAIAPRPETTPGLAAKLREGPWRWVAGPEWALASALVVVLISIVGAPLIQFTVQPVAGFVRLAVPPMRTPSTLPPMITSAQVSSTVGIGRGPVRLTDRPVLDARMDKLRYLRNAIYDDYNGRSWSRTDTQFTDSQETPHSVSIDEMQQHNEFEWFVRLRQPLRSIPVPGEIISIQDPPMGLPVRPDGIVQVQDGVTSQTVAGISWESTTPIDAPDAADYPEYIGDYKNTANIPASVMNLARQVSARETKAWDKAKAIKHEIESRIKYNINAASSPGEVNPVEYALFEQKEAYCDLYASSMVLMARSVGIPARYVTGFLPKPDVLSADGTVTVREKDAHAWAELFFKDVGWVIFDATEGAEEVEGGGLGSGTDERPWYQREWFVRILDGAVLLVAVVGLLYGRRLLSFRKKNVNFRTDLDNVYVTFTQALHRATGVRRGIGVTADEYIRTVLPLLGSAAAEAKAVSNDFVRAYYAPGMIDAGTVTQMKERVRLLKETLKRLPRPKHS